MSINYITFNQDHSFLAVATTDGFRIYSTDPFSLVFQTPLAENAATGDISVLEMLFSTSLVAMIRSPRLLRIINTKRQSTICELTFPSRVGALKLNRKRLVVVLEAAIFIYDIQTMKTLHQLTTPANPYALCALSPNPEHNYVAYPMRRSPAVPANSPAHIPPAAPKGGEPMGGDVMLFDANEMHEIKVIPAHQAPLSCMVINSEGTLLATASEKGTVIRVFELPSAKKLYQFRRGSMPARIYSMSFNATSTLLCVTSATETIHIFKLSPQSGSSISDGGDADVPTSPLYEQSFDGRDRSQSPGMASDPNASTDLDVSTTANSAAADNAAAARPKNPGFMSLMRRTSQNVSTSLVSRAAGYLPQAVTEIWEPARDFAWVKVPRSKIGGQPVKSVVAMAANAPQALVATSEGEYLVYNIDLEKGGEGTLIRQYSIKEKSDGHSGLYAE